MNPRVVGRYEILSQLGRGGMATVHLARQPALNREVALKELHPSRAAEPEFAQRFLQESRVASAISHPSVVSVIEYFEHEGAPFIAMEYLERGSLRPLVGRLTLAHVAGVLESMLAGLGEAHAQGVVHRDLKPENVLLTADGMAKVADFGIAKALGQVQMSELRTATGTVVGTPAYMAPEQALSGEITPATDLYATGLIAYELLAGHHPYHDVTAPMALMLRQANDPPPPLGLVRADLPPGVVAWVHAMLAKDPAQRPASVTHAWDWLEGVIADELGARWRRAAALPADEEETGYVSTVVTALPASLRLAAAPPAPPALPAAPAAPSPAAPPAPLASSAPNLPSPPHDDPPAPADPPPSEFVLPRSRRPRRRSLLAGMAASLVLAAGAAGLSLSPGDEPRADAAPKPQGPSVAERVREAVTPALRANRRVTAELRDLAPGSDPGDALERAAAALPVTREALERADVADARAALRAQVGYLDAVRGTLRLDPGEAEKLSGASARLVARLERIEPLVPDAADSVGGAKKLKAWAIAELAPEPTLVEPAPTPAAPAAPTTAPADAASAQSPAADPSPTPTASPTATATPTATPPAADTSQPEAATPAQTRRLRPHRALRRILRRQLVKPPGA
jgi:hypothetical protein